MALFYAPYVNSYRRYQAGTFAPTRLVAGVDNRTCGLRILGHSPQAIRVENRCPGADANPYLAFAATLAAGLYGIENELPFAGLYQGDAYKDPKVREIPKTLYEAIRHLETSREARRVARHSAVTLPAFQLSMKHPPELHSKENEGRACKVFCVSPAGYVICFARRAFAPRRRWRNSLMPVSIGGSAWSTSWPPRGSPCTRL